MKNTWEAFSHREGDILEIIFLDRQGLQGCIAPIKHLSDKVICCVTYRGPHMPCWETQMSWEMTDLLCLPAAWHRCYVSWFSSLLRRKRNREATAEKTPGTFAFPPPNLWASLETPSAQHETAAFPTAWSSLLQGWNRGCTEKQLRQGYN